MRDNNFSLEKENGKYKFSLADTGWYWSGNEGDALGFIMRIAYSDIKDTFLQKVTQEGISWSAFKPLLLKAASRKDGLYELSGDNRMWYFGETYADDLNELADSYKRELEELGWSTEDAEKESTAKLDHTHITYDVFKKEYGSKYASIMKTMINKSESFKDFINNLNDDDFKYDWVECRAQYNLRSQRYGSMSHSRRACAQTINLPTIRQHAHKFRPVSRLND